MSMIADGHTDDRAFAARRHRLRRRAAVLARVEDGVHADPDRRLRRPVRRELLVPAHRGVEGADPVALGAAADPRRPLAAAGSWSPEEEFNVLPVAQTARRISELGRPGVDRRPRPARGPRRALGHLELRQRRNDPAPGAGDRDHQPGARLRPRPRHRLDRAGQARRPGRARRQPAGEHPQLDRASATPSPTASCTTATWTRSRGGTRRRQPFWFEQSAGGDYTAGATVGLPHED